MITILPYDIILYICYYFNSVKDVNKLIILNKELNTVGNELFYLDWGRNLYSKEFWDRANKRSISTNFPYLGMKRELLRIENFQNTLIKKNLEKWNKEDFYKYWNSLEELLKSKKNNSSKIINSLSSNFNQLSISNCTNSHSNLEFLKLKKFQNYLYSH